MSRIFSQVVPLNPLELERFYLDTINKLAGTSTSLADEEQKSIVTTNGRITELARGINQLARELTMNRARVTHLESRLRDIEGQL